MNRSILIVICDFLLVSLLAFSTVDINKVADEGTQPNVRVDIVTNQLESGRDLAAAMKLALTEERKSRDLLLGELTKTRDVASQREKQVQSIQQALQTREEEAQRLQQQQGVLQQQFAAAQTNIQALSQQLQSTSSEAVLSKERLAALEAEKKKQTEQAAALQQQISQLTKSNGCPASSRSLRPRNVLPANRSLT